MKKISKEYKRGFLKAIAHLRSIQDKSFDWHIRAFGEDGADCKDYAAWIKKKLK